MNINELYQQSKSNPSIEQKLVQNLSERFRVILQHRVSVDEDREDILQDTMMAVINKYKEIEFKVSFTAWAYKVLENNLLNYYRNKATARRKMEQMTSEKIQPTVLNFDPIVKHKLLGCFKKLCRANERYARVINLHYQGFNINEICADMDTSTNNIYIILSRARSMLKNCLEKGELK